MLQKSGSAAHIQVWCTVPHIRVRPHTHIYGHVLFGVIIVCSVALLVDQRPPRRQHFPKHTHLYLIRTTSVRLQAVFGAPRRAAMGATTTNDYSDLAGLPTHSNSVRWSDDNILAIAAGPTVHIAQPCTSPQLATPTPMAHQPRHLLTASLSHANAHVTREFVDFGPVEVDGGYQGAGNPIHVLRCGRTSAAQHTRSITMHPGLPSPETTCSTPTTPTQASPTLPGPHPALAPAAVPCSLSLVTITPSMCTGPQRLLWQPGRSKRTWVLP